MASSPALGSKPNNTDAGGEPARKVESSVRLSLRLWPGSGGSEDGRTGRQPEKSTHCNLPQSQATSQGRVGEAVD